MFSKKIFLSLFVLGFIRTFGQTVDNIDKELLSKIQAFTPRNHILYDLQTGYLNNDSLKDAIAVFRSIYELVQDSVNARERVRPLLLFFQNPDQSFSQIKRHDSLILCQTCGGVFGDPYMGSAIKDHSFSISFYGGSRFKWTRNITFTYDKKIANFILTKDVGGEFDSLSPDSTFTERNFLKTSDKVITIDTYDVTKGWE